MIFICMPLSRRAIQLSPLIITLATFSTPCHCWKGSGFEKGVCVHFSTPWALPLGAWLVWSLSSEGPGLPSLVQSPPCSLSVNPFSMLLPMGSHGWSGLGCYSGSSISLPFKYLSRLLPDAPWTPLWLLWYYQGPQYPPLHPSWHSPPPNAPNIQQAF